MKFHMHLLPTYFPGRDPPFSVFLQQILEQVQLAEELGWECLLSTPVPYEQVVVTQFMHLWRDQE